MLLWENYIPLTKLHEVNIGIKFPHFHLFIWKAEETEYLQWPGLGQGKAVTLRTQCASLRDPTA